MESTTPHEPVFVYGTLKRHGANAVHLSGAIYGGPARTEAGYTLYSLGDYPGMVAEPGAGGGVVGELWSASPELLAKLDAFEGVDEGLYRRERVWLVGRGPGAWAWAYIYARSVEGLLPCGDFWPAESSR